MPVLIIIYIDDTQWDGPLQKKTVNIHASQKNSGCHEIQLAFKLISLMVKTSDPSELLCCTVF